MVQDTTTEAEPKPVLPGNHGQFGEDNATEKAKTMDDHTSPADPPSKGPRQTNAGERS